MPGRISRESPALLVLMLSLFMVACGGPSSQGSSPAATRHHGGGTLNVRISGDWGASISPPTATALPGHELILALYDRLVDLEPSGKIIPSLAKSWTATPTSLTLTVRRDVTCSDGTPFTPSAIANAIRYYTAPATKSPWAIGTLGPGPYTVTADDSAGTVTLSSAAAFNEMLQGLATPYAGLVCPAGTAPGANNESKPHGTGPYTVSEAVHGDHMTLTLRNDWKWGPAGTTAADLPATLVYKVVANETTAANLLTTGGLDIASISGPDVTRLVSDKSILTTGALSFAPHSLIVNQQAGHVGQDMRVRQAIMTAVDPKAWSKAELGDYQVVSPSVFGRRMDCFDPNAGKLLPKPDVAAAKKILLDDGYAPDSTGIMAKGGKELTLDILGNPGQNSGPEYLLSQLSQLGAKATLDRADVLTFATNLHAGKFDVAVPTYQATGPNPTTVSRFYGGPTFEKGGQNYYGDTDPVLDDLRDRAVQAPLNQRCAIWVQYQERILSQYHALPLDNQEFMWFTRKVDVAPTAIFLSAWTFRQRP